MRPYSCPLWWETLPVGGRPVMVHQSHAKFMECIKWRYAYYGAPVEPFMDVICYDEHAPGAIMYTVPK